MQQVDELNTIIETMATTSAVMPTPSLGYRDSATALCGDQRLTNLEKRQAEEIQQLKLALEQVSHDYEVALSRAAIAEQERRHYEALCVQTQGIRNASRDLESENEELVTEIQDVMHEAEELQAQLQQALIDKQVLERLNHALEQERDEIAERFHERQNNVLTMDEVQEQREMVRREERAKFFAMLAEQKRMEDFIVKLQKQNDAMEMEIKRLRTALRSARYGPPNGPNDSNPRSYNNWLSNAKDFFVQEGRDQSTLKDENSSTSAHLHSSSTSNVASRMSVSGRNLTALIGGSTKALSSSLSGVPNRFALATVAEDEPSSAQNLPRKPRRASLGDNLPQEGLPKVKPSPAHDNAYSSRRRSAGDSDKVLAERDFEMTANAARPEDDLPQEEDNMPRNLMPYNQIDSSERPFEIVDKRGSIKQVSTDTSTFYCSFGGKDRDYESDDDENFYCDTDVAKEKPMITTALSARLGDDNFDEDAEHILDISSIMAKGAKATQHRNTVRQKCGNFDPLNMSSHQELQKKKNFIKRISVSGSIKSGKDDESCAEGENQRGSLDFSGGSQSTADDKHAELSDEGDQLDINTIMSRGAKAVKHRNAVKKGNSQIDPLNMSIHNNPAQIAMRNSSQGAPAQDKKHNMKFPVKGLLKTVKKKNELADKFYRD